MICERCGKKYENPAKLFGAPDSIHPSDRVCFECYEKMVAEFEMGMDIDLDCYLYLQKEAGKREVVAVMDDSEFTGNEIKMIASQMVLGFNLRKQAIALAHGIVARYIDASGNLVFDAPYELVKIAQSIIKKSEGK